MTTIFNYFEEFKDYYNNNSFTKGILLNNLDNEINFIKNRNLELLEDLHKLNLNLVKQTKKKIIFEGNFFILTIYEYENDFNDYENEINLNMINKHYLFYNNNGFNSGVIGTILNIDATGKDLEKFRKENNINNFFKENKTYSIQITEKFHNVVNINDLNKNEKKNIFIQLLNNINSFYSIYDKIILNLKSLDQIQIYKLDKEVTYVYDNSKKYKSKFIVKLFDMSTSQIDQKIKNKNVAIDKKQDLKNLINLFGFSEYKKFSDINSIINDFTNFNPKEKSTESDLYFRNISNEIEFSDINNTDFNFYKNKFKKSKKFSENSEITGFRLIGGKKKKSKKKSDTDSSEKKSKKKNRKLKENYKYKKKNKKYYSEDDDLDSEISKEYKYKKRKSEDDSSEDYNEYYDKEPSKNYKKSKKFIDDSDSFDLSDDDLDDDETSVLLTDNRKLNISDETDNSIMDSMTSPLDVLQPNNNNNSSNGNSIANLFNENVTRLPNPAKIHQQAYQNQFGINQFNPDYSTPNNFQMQPNNDPVSSEYAGSIINNNQNFMNPNHQNMYNQQYMGNNIQYPNIPQNNLDPNLFNQNMMQGNIDPNLLNQNIMQGNIDPNLLNQNNLTQNFSNQNMMQGNIDPNLQYPNLYQNGINPNMLQQGMNGFNQQNPYLNQFDNLSGGKKKIYK